MKTKVRLKIFITCALVAVIGVAVLFAVGIFKFPHPDSIIADSGRKKLTVGVCIYNYNDVFLADVRSAIEAAAEGASVELLMFDSAGDQNTQNEQIDLMIQKGVNALAINIVNIDAGAAVIDKAKKVGIPIVLFNREPFADDIASYSKARYAGVKPGDSGTCQGKLILDIWKSNPKYDTNSDGKMQYVMLTGNPDSPESGARTQYAIDTVVAGGVAVDEMEERPAYWDTKKAAEEMTALLAENGDKIEFIIANGDSMAFGAIEALQAEGYNEGGDGKYIPVVGIDGTDQAIDYINKGYMSGSVAQDAVGLGNATFKLAANAAVGKDFLAGTDYKYDESGIAVRIPYIPIKQK